MKYKLSDLIDIGKNQKLLDSFCDVMGVAAAIIDLEGKVLVGSRWQRICTDFHRMNERACEKCIESDTKLANELQQEKRFSIYQCRNGLTDAASPIIIEGEHIANAFVGQFFLKKPDQEFFRRQAATYEFKETDYLDALFEVPIVKEKDLPAMLDVLTNFAGMIAGMGLDHIKQKEAQDALRESEERYRTLFHDIADPIVIFKEEEPNTILDCNKAMIEKYGYSREEVLKMIPHDFHLPAELEGVLKNIRSEESLPHEYIHIGKDNKRYFVDVHSRKITYKGEGAQLSIIRDITDRKMAEAERERLTHAIDQAAEVIVIMDADGNVQYANPAFERVTGYSREEVIGENPQFLKSCEHEDSFYRQMWQTITEGHTWRGKLSKRKKDGTFYTEEASISPVLDGTGDVVNFVAVNRDITDEIRMEEKLRQAQKMESIGTLAGGIAHDFNNILFPLVGYAEMLKLDLPADSPLHGHVDEILHAALRSKALVKQILAFSRQGDQDIKPIKLQPIVKEAIKLLRSSIPTTIDIQKNIDPGCGVVVADPTQVHQVVMNLATNAYHAMEETGGKLNVNLKQVRLESGQSVFPELTPGEYSLLTVTDTGVGIGSDVMAKIFDPYFTTKETGKGTGLGLSVVQGIVKSCNGDIRIYSEPGKGTEIKVYLPIMARKVDDMQFKLSEPILVGTEKILLVDDEEAIVRIEQQMLERLGYRVSIRTGSVDALEAFKANPDSFDLVITDLTMPNMTGDKLSGELIKIRSDIPVILCTGFSEMMSKKNAESLGIEGFLMKPVVMKDLSSMIRKVLDKNKSSINQKNI